MASKARSAPFEDLSNVEFETSEDVDVIDKFSSMHLREELTRGIYAYGNYTQFLFDIKAIWKGCEKAGHFVT